MLPNFLHIGVQKAGSTWIYHALKEHPEIHMPENEPVNYFDVRYHKGEDWYKSQFEEYEREKVVGDESPGYIKHPLAPKRAFELVPSAKIIICLRNPVERAYSQWWSAESYWTNGKFDRCTFHHATNDVFVTPGLYHYHISRWEKYFKKNRIKIVFFDDLKKNNKKFIRDIYSFLGVEKKYEPSIIGKKVQSGKSRVGPNRGKSIDVESKIRKKLSNISNKINSPKAKSIFKTIYSKTLEKVIPSRFYLEKKEYKESGMTKSTKKFLEKTYIKDVKKLEEKVDRDLSGWFEVIDY